MKKTLSVIVLFFASLAIAHPIKMSTAKMEIDNEIASVNLNLFWDDFSEHLITTYRNQVIANDSDKLSMKIISDYLHRNFQVRLNGNAVGVSVQSFSLNEELNTLQVKFTPFSVENVSLLEVNYSVLMDAFDKQSNVLHVVSSGERKSLQFTSRNKIQSLKL